MDRGIPTEEVLEEMRSSEPAISYLVGTPKGRLTKLEKEFLNLPWQEVRQSVDVKLLEQDGELFILARSAQRVKKERSMRRRRLKQLWKRLKELQDQKLSRDDLLLKLGAAKKAAGRVWGLAQIVLPDNGQEVTPQTFRFSLNKKKFRVILRREGHYILRSNLVEEDPATLWQRYI